MSTFEELTKNRLMALDELSEAKRMQMPDDPPSAGYCPEAWFLGPKGENHELLQRLLTEALESHVRHRQEFQIGDPELISGDDKDTHEYAVGVRHLEREARRLFEYLRWSAPISSMRHQGHMLWDQVLPATIGYFAAMLYNQNNVAAEASPVTTLLELRVGEDLCSMLGFEEHLQTSPNSKQYDIVPWGHITCGGSIANIEALWAARNAKYFPWAIREALRQRGGPLANASRIEVRTCNGTTKTLVDLSDWEVLNLPIDEAVVLPERLQVECKISPAVTQKAIEEFELPNLGLLAFARKFPTAMASLPVIFAPATAHYSWPKAATLLGLGKNAIQKVPVDLDARMDLVALRTSLDDCIKTKTPVIAVIAVIGSTEESSVDNLVGIVAMREDCRRDGLDFAIHCDAAWGGYFASMIRYGTPPPVGGIVPPTLVAASQMVSAAPPDPTPAWPMSDYVRRQFQALHHADSITVDPHKGGYIPYPAGALCYSNSSMRNMISLKSPVVFHNETEPTVGIFGIEGSKPGAAAAAVWLAHRVIRPTREGYGAILERCMWTATRLYCRLVTMQHRYPWLKVVPFTRLPTERDGKSIAEIDQEVARIASFATESNDQFKKQVSVGEFGPDLVINAFACNFYTNGKLNTDFDKLNKLNDRIYELCSATSPKDYRDDDTLELMLTGSNFDPGDYGQTFVNEFCKKLGVSVTHGKKVSFLIATSMDPWRTNTSKGDFLDDLELAFVKAATTAVKELGGDWR